MRVLGVDPGLERTGWAVLSDGQPALLESSGLISTPSTMALPLRLRRLHEALLKVLDEHSPAELALEQLFFMRSTRAIAGTSQARGVILLAAELRATPVSEYNPRDVKMSVTGNGAALKPQMIKMVQLLLKLPQPLHPDDVADAAAIGLCHLRTRKFLERIA